VSAFSECTTLTNLYLPATPPALGASVFQDTGSSGTLSIHVGSGNIGAYTSTWGVSVNTSAGGNTGKYGTNHKAINIVN
jgi:hypothetical protein